MKTIKIGQGIDIHAFDALYTGPATTITLGGVNIAYVKPLLAHSDGDVLLHALCDAILGALAMGDIGQLYPDSDPAYRDVNSRVLLRDVVRRASEAGYQLGNADLTVVAEYPRVSIHSLAMRENIAADCAVALDAVSVKATTSENLGFTGRSEGIACFAQVLMLPVEPGSA